jgi:hypothetical protein
MMASDEHKRNIREMYVGMVSNWTQDEIVNHIIYWRDKSDGLTAEVERDRTVKHLRLRITALSKKLTATRKAAIEFMRGRAFDDLVRKKQAGA